MTNYQDKTTRLIAALRDLDGDIRLAKPTSNLFRDRAPAPTRRLDVSEFNRVIEVDPTDHWVTVEGMTTYDDLVAATLPHGLMPAVVPQLKSITIGGAVAGVGIESSSFKHGLVHETLLEMDVLSGNGEVVTCTPTNEHRQLFCGFPNSYGTLGYALKLKAKLVPTKRYVKIEHVRHSDPVEYFRDLGDWCKKDIDFLDGSVFSPTELYLSIGQFTDEAPHTSDYTFEQIYYRSIREKQVDFLTCHDYLWRWDTDWFWCSKNLLAQNPLIRRLYGRRRLNSVFYTKVMRWNAKWGLTNIINRLTGTYAESVIQDVDIPIDRAPEFLEFFDAEIGIRPVWICPFRSPASTLHFPLYPTDPDELYVNFGFWDVVRDRTQRPDGYFNRKVERKVEQLGGIKSLYSDSYYEPEKFWQLYNQTEYRALKDRYDPQQRLKDLYRKCVLRQ